MTNANNFNTNCKSPCNPNNEVSPANNIIRESCCTGQSGCLWDGDLNSLVLEPIYVQKVYDSALFNLQGISYAEGQQFSPKLPVGSTIVKINYINITKYFDPTDCNNENNFKIKPCTTLQGAQFVQCCDCDEKVVGPDGRLSEKIIYADTSACDSSGRGTPVFGSQNIKLKGMVIIEMSIEYIDPEVGGCPIPQVLTGCFTVVAPGSGGDLVLTNFFELCIPSVFDGAFYPRFTELCNASLTGRLMTNNLVRDVTVLPDGTVVANILISICISCEKKIVVPVQLCVLSTGFTQLSPDSGMICGSFPSLFPKQIDENSVSNVGGSNNGCGKHPCCNQTQL
ncbi:hypothetical protein JYG23_00830 [Sedimentibacter sp. zth1]|uniref:hypothetical protein n=1 Tax=Sedimentibacter sp. zth1 TaxID=2816908 RepID=UPI001A92CDC2|nr:hypothetical protein [Sedimentibacter sp. zth1]QSX06044.1 hypothetical protein JYG23_00830 [Sedimentibacter sp. zth1]